MRRCLALARRADGRTSPNPIVGCVIVKAGRVLAEGWHRGPGMPHAEADALARLGGRSRGATLYVNLEPCAHTTGRRTAPCTPLVLAAGVRRVVYGTLDPWPGHGGGLKALAAAGIEVVGPVEEEACRRANEAFLVHATRGRAHFTLKAAMTLDGRIATARGESRWITGEAARHDVHRRRNLADAILVGAGTVRADDPLLTARGVARPRDPARVILDGSLTTSPRARMLHAGSNAPTLFAATRQAPARRAAALEAAGGEVLRLPGAGAGVSLSALARTLARRDLVRVLVEGGAEVHAAFLAAGLCDRLLLYVAPKAIGGADAPAWLGGEGILRLAAAHRFRFDGAPRRLGDDLLLELVPIG